MMIDDDTLKKLLRIDDELMRLCKWLNEKRETTVSSRLIPLVDASRTFCWRRVRTNCTKYGRCWLAGSLAPKHLQGNL